MNLALNNDDMDATVIYYGSLVTEPETLSSINWPILGIFAELDQGRVTKSAREHCDLFGGLEGLRALEAGAAGLRGHAKMCESGTQRNTVLAQPSATKQRRPPPGRGARARQ